MKVRTMMSDRAWRAEGRGQGPSQLANCTVRVYGRPSVSAREAIAEALADGVEEYDEYDYLQERIARWDRERIEDEIEQCYYDAHDECCWGMHDRYTDWAEEDRLWEQEMREYDHAWAVMHLARTIVRHRPLV